MSYQAQFYPETRFGGFSDIDGTVAFLVRVNALLQPSFQVLDVGCGRGASTNDPIAFRRSLAISCEKVASVIGIDVDPAARSNPLLSEFRLLEGDRWPLDDDSIDLIHCDHVLEHVPQPGQFFAEARRVLKDQGYLCIRTPNRWSYVALCAWLIPNRYHSRVLSVVQNGRQEQDIFPTLYRCNSVRRLKRQMAAHGFDAVVYTYEAEPSYLSFARLAYWLGVLHQRYAPRFLKPSIFAFGHLHKPSPEPLPASSDLATPR